MSCCIWPGCTLVIDRFMHCFRHADLRGIPKLVKPPYRMPMRSPKRIKEQPVYVKIVKGKIEQADGVCRIQSPVCCYWATGLHHPVKRSPATWLNEQGLIPCCDSCNQWVELNPDEAIEKGFSKSKF